MVPGHARGAAAQPPASRHLVGVTSNTYDKATALLPALLNERLPELGIDFALIYPSFGLTINGITQDDLHLAACRAYNMMTADMFAPYTARFAPVAIIPSRHRMKPLRSWNMRSSNVASKRSCCAATNEPSQARLRNRSAEGRLVLRYHRPRQPL